MKKKNMVYSGISVAILLICIGIFTYKYNKVNSEYVRNITVDEYSMGEKVELQDFIITVNSFKEKEKNEEEVVYEIKYNVENKSSSGKEFEKSINDIKKESTLADIMIEYGTNYPTILAKSNENMQIEYRISREDYNALKEKDNFGFYISNKFYLEECKDRFVNEKEYYRKVVNLKLQ